MGLAAAKVLGRENYIIIVGRTKGKLNNALSELKKDGIEAEAYACDISNRRAVNELAAYAGSLGRISSVIHSAGMSPHMGDAKTIMLVNAIGTININEAFYNVMEEGACLLDVSSMSGYMVPDLIMPKKKYKYSRIDKEAFFKKMMKRVNLFPTKLRSDIAYGISKNFVIWYAKTDAVKFGEKGIRVLSISPGSFETPMGELERERVKEHLKNSAIKRPGKVEEIAELFAFCVSNKASYITGIDILCDGGCIAANNGRLQRA